jgi:hypothetical protein
MIRIEQIKYDGWTINRCVYNGDKLIATIADHRKTSRKCSPNVAGDWAVLWVTGRVDWHNTLADAKDSALKGMANRV